MATIAYLRVSTDQQTDAGNGINAQLDACTRAAGEQLAGVFRDEGISGSASLEKRPGLLAAIGELGKGDVLIVAKRDRLGRGDPLLIAMIESAVKRKGARIVSAAGEGTDSDDPSAILMRRMIDAFAEYERLIIGARTKGALQAKKARGEKTGGLAPYGYMLGDDGKHLEPVEIEQSVIREARELHQAGLSLRKIAGELSSRGFNARNGAIFQANQIKRMLA